MAAKTRLVIMLAAVAVANLAMVRRTDAGNLDVYDSLSAFQSALTTSTSFNFNSVALNDSGFASFAVPPGYTDPTTGTNITYLNADAGHINVTSADYYGPSFFPSNTLNRSADVPDTATELITLKGSYQAIGIYFSTGHQGVFTFTLSNGDSYVDSNTPAFGSVAFIGFTDSTSFTSMTISDPRNFILDVYIGSLPEPSTLTLSCTALFALVGHGWRRRRRARV
jgi:hypothetical protein